MSVYLFFEKKLPFREKKRKVVRWIQYVIEKEGKKSKRINIITTGDREIIKLNKKFLGRSYRTDVISFPMNGGIEIEGEIYISLDTVTENAIQWGVTTREEWRRVVIHGILHLIGYLDNNRDEQRIMKEKEDYYLERFPE
ncbi:MAG TPA: rRNA maturation RNase YbeY [Bacteroidetes bacterium]|nr:rRNA maturation RNase YbeY [Bacteroidota bacterium]